MAVQDIITRVQNELEDLTGESSSSWTDPDYILGKLVTVGDDIAVRLQLLDLNYNTQEVILFNIPANTTSLASFLQTGGELAEMILPKSVEWRVAGKNQTQTGPTVLGVFPRAATPRFSAGSSPQAPRPFAENWQGSWCWPGC